jgi:serine palmitoyltransferase
MGRIFDYNVYGHFTYTGEKVPAINLGSYNYLGFAENAGKCIDHVIDAVHTYGIGPAGRKTEVGNMDIHSDLERRVANFVGKEDAIVFSMGYATNSTSLPALAGPGGLIISDSLNHASIVVGCRTSGAKIKTFKHNDPQDLERVIRQAIAEGQPRTHRNWRKILIVVEGIYSMEGEILRLPEIIEIKKKYKAYLYVDEAHSIGALGSHAKGVCDYYGIDPKEVDVLMGTFTKSFGSVGGYIAGDRNLIRYLRQTSYSSVYEETMSVPCVRMIISSLDVITGADGTDEGQKRITALRENSNFFRNRLKELGFRVAGDEDSPVIPMMLYHPAKIAGFSRLCLLENVAVVVVGFPATSLLASRARFCISAGHTREHLERALDSISQIGDRLMLKYGDV